MHAGLVECVVKDNSSLVRGDNDEEGFFLLSIVSKLKFRKRFVGKDEDGRCSIVPRKAILFSNTLVLRGRMHSVLIIAERQGQRQLQS